MTVLSDPADERPLQRSALGAASVAAIAHIGLGLGLLPGWAFSKYPDAAHALLAGKLHAEEGADFSPLYLLLNVWLSPEHLRVAQSLVGAAIVLAIFFAARRGIGDLAAALAACIGAIASVVLVYEHVLEPDIWVAALLAGGTALLLGTRRTSRSLAFAGATLGLCAAARPSGLAFVVIAALWLWRVHATSRARTISVFLAAALTFAFLPSAIAKARIGSQLGATMSVGTVWVMGNRPESMGLGANPSQLAKLYELQISSVDKPDYAHALYRRLARADDPSLSQSGTERYWMRKVLAFMRYEPAAFVRLELRKLVFFLFGPDGHDIASARRAAARIERRAAVPSHWILIAALAGASLAIIRRRGGLLLPGLLVGLLAALGVFFYVVSRYRLAAVPLCAIFAAYAVASLWEARRDRRALAIACGAWLVPLAANALETITRIESALLRRAEATAEAAGMEPARSTGNLPEATRLFATVQGMMPPSTGVRPLRGIPFEAPALALESGRLSIERFGLDTPVDTLFAAELARRGGKCDEALAAMESIPDSTIIAVFDELLEKHLIAENCLLSRGDRAGAARAAANALKAAPGTVTALAHAIAAAEAMGSASDAARWNEELFALHDPLSAHCALAEARLAWNNPSAAVADTAAILATFPDAGVVLWLRAAALAQLGRDADALHAYDLALRAFPDHGFRTLPFEKLITAGLQRAPTAELLSLAAEHRLRQGRIEEARTLARRATEAFAGDVPAYHLKRLPLIERARPPGIVVVPE